jgi:pSer/pThr/pTyr-binding forkhead associated (FHA) protein
MLNAALTIEGRVNAVRLADDGPWLIGRGDKADIRFPDDLGCSRTQARITQDFDGEFVLENLSASTATRLEGEVLKASTTLRDSFSFLEIFRQERGKGRGSRRR